MNTIWREQKPGAKDILTFWKASRAKHGDNYSAIQDELRTWYKSLPKAHPAKKLSRYKWVDEFGPWRDRDISWPGGGGPRYDVPHNRTQIPCKVPEAGWRFASPEEMQRQIDIGLVQFRDDHTEPPFRKAHLLPIPQEQEASTTSADESEAGDEEEDEDEAGMSVMPSLIQKQAQVSVKLLRRLFGGRKVFPNPKDHEVLARLIEYVTEPDDLILDSFAGSGTTGHAVLQLNHDNEESKRRFLLVEMDDTIARTVTAQRLTRVIDTFAECQTGVGGQSGKAPPPPEGFRFCTLAAPMFDEAGNVRAGVAFRDLAAHVYFTETGEPLPSRSRKDSPLLGVHRGTAVYLLFNGVLGDKRPAGGNVLTGAVLDGLPPHAGPRVVYGEGCRLGAGRLTRDGVTFKQVPYAIRVT